MPPRPLEGQSEMVWLGHLQISWLFGEVKEGQVTPALAKTPCGIFISFSPKAGISAMCS